ncbi:hypothetical protein TorRG33x02_278670, partial [Trema orientale]
FLFSLSSSRYFVQFLFQCPSTPQWKHFPLGFFSLELLFLLLLLFFFFLFPPLLFFPFPLICLFFFLSLLEEGPASAIFPSAAFVSGSFSFEIDSKVWSSFRSSVKL